MKIKVAFLALVVIFAATPIVLALAENAAPSGMPDVLIWVDARNVGANAVSITYPKVITRTQAAADLTRLLQETGWSAASVNITDGSIMKTGEFPMTAIEFVTPNALQADGIIPVEGITKAFRNMTSIQVQYLTPATFYFRGWGDFENKWVKITLIRGNNAYQYSIHIKDSRFSDLGLPALATQGNPTNTAGQKSGVTLLTIVLIVVLALMAATLAYVFTARYTRNKQSELAKESPPRTRPPGTASPTGSGGQGRRS